MSTCSGINSVGISPPSITGLPSSFNLSTLSNLARRSGSSLRAPTSSFTFACCVHLSLARQVSSKRPWSKCCPCSSDWSQRTLQLVTQVCRLVCVNQ